MASYVACLPDDLDIAAGALPYWRLAHPRTGEASLYLPYIPYSSDAGPSKPSKILQVSKLAPTRGRTWFIRDDTIQDGSMLLHTPVDPFFLALPCVLALLSPSATGHSELTLHAATTIPFQPLSDLISQAASHPALNLAPPYQTKPDLKGKKPETAKLQVGRHNQDVETLLATPEVGKVFKLLCDRKVLASNLPSPPPDGETASAPEDTTTYYRPSSRAILRILKAKVAHLADPSQIARFESLQRQLARDGLTEATDETLLAQARTKLACDHLAQYLPISVTAALIASNDFSLLAAHNETKAAAVAAQAAANIAATAKKPIAAAVKKKQKQGSRAVEALKKVDTRSMMKMTSFFQKREPNKAVEVKAKAVVDT